MASSNVSLKLLIDRKMERVLFAEAGKEFVDFLFSILTLPIGTIIKVLNKDDMVGCLARLYESIKDLNNDFMQPNQQKNVVLKPKSSLSFVYPQVPLLPLEEWASPPAPPTVATTFYNCERCSIVSSSSRCRYCCSTLSTTVVTHYVPKPTAEPVAVAEGGFVKGVVTYMVMDDLVVTPMSTISSITLLNKFNIKEVGSLEEKVVHIGMDEGLELLKNALASKTVLTNVFLGEVVKTKSYSMAQK